MRNTSVTQMAEPAKMTKQRKTIQYIFQIELKIKNAVNTSSKSKKTYF